MSIIALAFLVVASQLASGVQAVERISPQAAAERISRCGLGQVTIRYDDLLQSDVLTAREVTTVTDEQLGCADRAASYYDLELPSAVQPRYEAIRSERAAVLGRAEARQWLAEHGLLGRMPHYEKGITNEAIFTHQAEKLCGPQAEGAFSSSYGPHVVSRKWLEREMRRSKFDSEAFTCLMNVTQAAGYKVGLPVG